MKALGFEGHADEHLLYRVMETIHSAYYSSMYGIVPSKSKKQIRCSRRLKSHLKYLSKEERRKYFAKIKFFNFE